MYDDLVLDDEEGEVDDCPEDGEQAVLRAYASKGSDPYNVNVLQCGHHVSCFGPGESNIIVRPR